MPNRVAEGTVERWAHERALVRVVVDGTDRLVVATRPGALRAVRFERGDRCRVELLDGARGLVGRLVERLGSLPPTRPTAAQRAQRRAQEMHVEESDASGASAGPDPSVGGYVAARLRERVAEIDPDGAGE